MKLHPRGHKFWTNLAYASRTLADLAEGEERQRLLDRAAEYAAKGGG